jgi:Na+/H+ antiporter NhaA
MQTPLRQFLHTETGGAVVLLGAVLAGLVWANLPGSTYEHFWETTVSVRIDDDGLDLPLREWVNSGLMTFFFFVVGLEARRELDLGELRERRRSIVPVLATIGGMVGAVGIYLAVNAGSSSAHGWGVALSTDTAFALGALALVGPRHLDRLRVYLLTMVVVDDILGLVVIAVVYPEDFRWAPLLLSLIPFAAILVLRRRRIRSGALFALLGLVAWVCFEKSGVDPVVVGLVMGMLVFAYTAPRSRLERATERFREFREQPTAELARSASAELRASTSWNERLQQLYHPWTSYVIVPIFALANTGIALDRDLLSRAATSAVTLGIVLGLVLGKPIGILVTSLVGTRLSRGRLKPPVGWASVAGIGTVAGIGFTVSLLIATLAFEGEQLEEAKIGILAAACAATLLTWLVFRLTAMLPRRRKLQALLGTAEPLNDLAVEVDPERDHVRGPMDARVTLVEYGDFECPYCGMAEAIVRELLRDFADVRYVWRHLPLSDVHAHAQQAAEAAEAAAAQDAFWEMYDLLLTRQSALRHADLIGYAEQLGLDVDRFSRDLSEHAGAARVAADVDSADLSGVSGTPTFFVNGRRHHGAYDIETLSEAVRAAGAQAVLTAT